MNKYEIIQQYHLQYYQGEEKQQVRHKSNKIHIGSACEKLPSLGIKSFLVYKSRLTESRVKYILHLSNLARDKTLDIKIPG